MIPDLAEIQDLPVPLALLDSQAPSDRLATLDRLDQLVLVDQLVLKANLDFKVQRVITGVQDHKVNEVKTELQEHPEIPVQLGSLDRQARSDQ